MTSDEILDGLTEIVAETLALENLRLEPSMTAADLDGWDSLANVQIIVAVETRFSVRFRTGEIAAIRNVGDLVARIAARITNRQVI